MNASQYKIMASMLVLGSFTVRALADHAGVKANTVKTWLNRHKDVFAALTTDAEPPGPSGGRRRQIWRLLPSAQPRVAELVEGLWHQYRQDAVSAEDATRAFADAETRIRIRTHLVRASLANDLAARDQELERARRWFAHQDNIIGDWRRNGFNPPEDLLEEIKALRSQLAAIDFGVDRLAWDLRVQTIQHVVDWLVDGLSSWFSQRQEERKSSFAPLCLDGNAPLASQLATIVLMCDKVAGVPSGRFVIAMINCLPRLQLQCDARKALCDALLEIGYSKIASALRSQIDGRPVDMASKRLVVHTVAGLDAFPRLAHNEEIGAWLDGLRNSSNWTDHAAPFYADALLHRPRTLRHYLIDGIYRPLQRVQRQIEEQDTVWQSLTDQLKQTNDQIQKKIKLLLNMQNDEVNDVTLDIKKTAALFTVRPRANGDTTPGVTAR